MKTIAAIALCMGLAIATLNIPLDTKAIYYRDANAVDQLVDEVLYAEVDYVHQTHNEHVVVDLQSKVNYLISRQTKFNQVSVNPSAFDCTTQCDNGDKETGPYSILGGKVTVYGGSTLKGKTAAEVYDSNDETEVELRVYVPSSVDSSTAPQENKILQSFNGGLSLARSDSSLTSVLEESSKLVDSNEFSVYVHDEIAQLNIGGIQEYFIQPESEVLTVPTNNSKGWSVTINAIKIKNESQLKNENQKLTAHWDLTSKYIYVPHIDAIQYVNYAEPAHYYFMNSKQLTCFNPSSNLSNQYSYICPADKFPGFDSYNDITFFFVGQNEKQVSVTLSPTDYIKKQEDGSYELLFRFSTSPQNSGDFYFGTTLFRKFYPTFNADKGTVTLRQKYEVAVGAKHINDNYRLPIIIVGLLVALIAVIILLVVFLKRVKLEDPAGQIPMYSVYKPTQPVYQTGVNVSGFQPTVATSVYNPAAQNVVVSSQQLRQSQTQVRQSQTMVRQSQNYVRNY